MVEFGASAMHKLKESAVVRRFRQEKRAYQHNHDQPLEGHAAAISDWLRHVYARLRTD
jgi:hypothetical protein